MVLRGTEKGVERGLQFLWCITHNNREAQEKVINITDLFPKILQAIAEEDSGRNALSMFRIFEFRGRLGFLICFPGLLHNLSKLDNAKKRLPVKEIAGLVKPIMKIPDHIISKKDKAITALTVANLLEGYASVSYCYLYLYTCNAVGSQWILLSLNTCGILCMSWHKEHSLALSLRT